MYAIRSYYEAEHDAHVVGGHGDGGQKGAAHRAHQGGDEKGQGGHAVHADAHEAGGLLVAGAGQHGLAVDGAREEELQKDKKRQRGPEGPDALGLDVV